MATSAKVGSFTCNASTGAQAITGLGFQPKAVIFWGGELATVSGNNEARRMFGCATSSTARWCCTTTDNCVAPAQSNQTFNDRVINLNTGDDVVVVRADFTSMDADGFTINLVTAAAKTVYYLALGGSSLSAKAGVLSTPYGGSVGPVTYSGVGFTPKALITALGAHNDTGALGYHTIHGIGLGSGSAAQMANAFYTNEVPPADVQALQVTNTQVLLIDDNANTNVQATLSSFNADGFVLNWSLMGPAAIRVGYLALGGTTSYSAFSFNEPTAASSQTVSGIGFQPAAVLLSSIGRPPSGTPTTAAIRHAFGAATSSSQRASWGYHITASAATASWPTVYSSTSYALALPEAGATSTSRADLTAFTNDGMTLNWVGTSGAGWQVIGLAIGEPGGVHVNYTISGGLQGVTGLGTTSQSGKANVTAPTLVGTTGLGTAGVVTGTYAAVSVSGMTASLGTTTQRYSGSHALTGLTATGSVTSATARIQTVVALFVDLQMAFEVPLIGQVKAARATSVEVMTIELPLPVITPDDPSDEKHWRTVEPPRGI